MEKKEMLKKLFSEGKSYSYNNACNKGNRGYAETLKEEYTSWQLRTELTLLKFFGKNNAIISRYEEHKKHHILGYGSDSFNRYHQCIISALKTAIDTLEVDPSLIIKSEQNTLDLSENRDVFIVHGHDDKLKQEVEILTNELGLNPIVLHRKADEGQTVIEKFEKNSKVGYAFILLTPDDMAFSKIEENILPENRTYNYRARQNVIFEFGYFVGKLGRNRVCCLYKEGVEIPSDINGLIYKKVSSNVEEVAFSIIKDLKAVGYSLLI